MSLLGARRDKLSQRDAGFTLVELVVAMLVIAIVLIAIITVQARALTTNADSQARQVATAVANQAMEQFRSMPWDSLRKGLASNFVSAAGGDPFVTGTTLTVNGETYDLKVAPSSNDQDLSIPRPPLFTGTGSNATLQTSPSGNGDQYTVRAYTTDDKSGNLNTVGLVVVSSWTSRVTGKTLYTVLTSAAYSASGCGSTLDAPYLAACQAAFDSHGSSGQIVVGASATDTPPDVTSATRVPLLPGSSFYDLSMSTATASSGVSSLQVSTANSLVSYGGTTLDDNSPSTSPNVAGYDKYSVKASTDTTTGAPGPDTSASNKVGSSSTHLSVAGGSWSMVWRSDMTRLSDLSAHTTDACSTGSENTPATEPCADAIIHEALYDPASASLWDGTNEFLLTKITDGVDRAWATRFTELNGSLAMGCGTVSDSGCVSAGASRTIGNIVIGSGNWDSTVTSGIPDAPDGLAVISNYADSIMTQRGTNQPAAAAMTVRSGSMKYWLGSASGYKTETLTAGTDLGPVVLAPVTFDGDGYVMLAEGTIDISPAASTIKGAGDPLCKAAACAISASNGTVNVTVRYTITPDDATVAPFVLTVVTVVNGSQAGASFKEVPDASA